MVEMCRCNIATVSVGVMSPIRLRKKRMNKQKLQDEQDQKTTQQCELDKQNESDEEALELLFEYARWLAVFPIAVKHFLRDPATYQWGREVSYKKRRYEIGPLLSDEDATLCNLFDVLKEKNMYRKKVIGIERSTFLIDEKGVLRNEWRKVQVQGHVSEVLEALKTLK